MSESQPVREMPNASLLVKLVQQRNGYMAQSEQLAVQFQQVQGAIQACSDIIKNVEQDALAQILKEDEEKLAKQEIQGEKVDGQANVKAAEQAAKK